MLIIGKFVGIVCQFHINLNFNFYKFSQIILNSLKISLEKRDLSKFKLRYLLEVQLPTPAKERDSIFVVQASFRKVQAEP